MPARINAADKDNANKFFRSKLIKMFLGIHVFIKHPGHDSTALTKDRKNEVAKIQDLRSMNRAIGYNLLACGLAPTLLDFNLVHPLDGVTSRDQLQDGYISSLKASDVEL